MREVLIAAALTVLIAFAGAVGAFALRCAPPGRRAGGIAVISAAAFLLPVGFILLAPQASPLLRFIVAIGCILPALKLVDAHLGVEAWRLMSLRQWVIFLAIPWTLCWRCHLLDPLVPRAASVRLLLRGLIEMLAGAALLIWAFHADLARFGFWTEHTVKLIGAYLLGFDGQFVFLTGALRLVGWNTHDLSRHPIIASTPADFWRRYNREPGRFFRENVFKPLGGVRHPVRGTLIVFVLNGILHEYLATLMLGRVTGWQLAFFAVHGAAVAATFRLRPRGAMRVISTTLTFIYGIAASVLFFKTVDLFWTSWYGDVG